MEIYKANFNTDKDLWLKFKVLSIQEKTTITDLINNFIKEYVDRKTKKK